MRMALTNRHMLIKTTMNEKTYMAVMVVISIVSSLIAVYQTIEMYNLRKKIEKLETQIIK